MPLAPENSVTPEPATTPLDPDLTLATIRQAQPGATLDEIHLRRWILEYP
jgi:hypothetical protein